MPEIATPAEPAARINDDATTGADTADGTYDPGEERLVAERLRALGYIE